MTAQCLCLCFLSCANRAAIPDYYLLLESELVDSPALRAPVRLDSLDLPLLEWAIFNETNIHRTMLGLDPLRYENRLHSGARAHSREMVAFGYFDHISPVTENETVEKRLQQMGIKNGYRGENIAIHPVVKRQEMMIRLVGNERPSRNSWRNRGTHYTYQEFAKDLVLRWLYSPPHRRNILNPLYRFLGVGAVPALFDQRDVFYVTQNFSSTNY